MLDKTTLAIDLLFGPFCTPPLEGVFSPAVDDGLYVRLNPLSVGDDTLHFQAKNLSQGFSQNVSYHLTVVPVVTK